MSAKEATFIVFRGGPDGGTDIQYKVPVEEGMVVLDAMHSIQGFQDPELAVRWNCKAAKCGSCSAEVNGKPSLMCKTRLDDYDLSQPIRVSPLKTFPVIKDLVTDVSWNYEVNKRIKGFTPPPETDPKLGDVKNWTYYQEDVDRAQEFRKCIECFLCQNVCHVLRNHDQKSQFYGPRFMVRLAQLEMHPMDQADRIPFIKEEAGVELCNITKCCTEVCPEEIHITDNAIIPLKERVVDRYYDPLFWLIRKLGFIK
ncbi:MAG: succinate dehydrogenase/fumarate reductase iron-sulfur subunit [Vampirovibrionales bacterium]|nr:succinate dehydrogenase/fumarate reductase iron-sulfur subunit [Vampirovibrionales bacterium]